MNGGQSCMQPLVDIGTHLVPMSVLVGNQVYDFFGSHRDSHLHTVLHVSMYSSIIRNSRSTGMKQTSKQWMC